MPPKSIPNPSPFGSDWRDCQSEHYMEVVRSGDHVTEKTLRTVLLEAGFSENEINELYVRAMMKEVDYVPRTSHPTD